MIDIMGSTLGSLETPAGITETAWYPIPAASGSREGGAVFSLVEEEPELVRRSHGYLDEYLQRKLRSLMRLGPGWDSYGARAIYARAVDAALVFLVRSAQYPRPSIVPTSKGGIQLEWHDGRIDVEIEFTPDGYAQLSGEDMRSGETVERWITPGHPAVGQWLEKLQVRG